MPIYRVVWEFAENNGGGFNEVYHCDTTDVADASKITGALQNARLSLLHPLNTFLRIRASDVAQNRVTAVYNINQDGTANPVGGALPVGAALVLQLGGISGGQRKLWMRGCPRQFYNKDSTTGKDKLDATFVTAMKLFFTHLKSVNNYGIRRLKPRGVGADFPRKMTRIDGTAGDGTSIVTLDQPPFYAVPSRVVIGGASKKDYPGLNGHFNVSKVAGADVTINYQTPRAEAATMNAGTMRAEAFLALSVFEPVRCGFDHMGTRTSRNPLTHSRGARRATRLRASL